MNNVLDFIRAAAPWVAVGLAVAIIAVRSGKRRARARTAAMVWRACVLACVLACASAQPSERCPETTPASVFPVLFKLKNSHIKKLESEKESAKVYYEKLLTQIVGKLEMYPKRLSLEEQGRFILGYYHQMQKKYEKREEK